MLTLASDKLERAEVIDESTQGAERRRGLRIAQNRPVKVYEPSSARYIPGQTEDVSATGLRIEMPLSAPVRPGKVISVHVGVGDTGNALANRRQMIPARIVWVDRTRRERSWTMTVGIEFIVNVAARLDAA